MRLTAPAVPLHQSDEFHMTVALATALVALGGLDDAVAALGRLPFDSDETRLYRPPIDALIALARGEPNLAVSAMAPLTTSLRVDPRRLVVAERVASVLGVAAHDLGMFDTAATLLGHAEAERERLQISVQAFMRPAVDAARDGCRAALGDARFDELAAHGAMLAFADLPDVTQVR